MRVLIFALVLGGCYSPSIDDCQFRCGGGMDCPDGTDCKDGFCRTASGSCPGGTDDANNACPGAPPVPSNCSTRFALENGGCGVLCGTSGGGSERSFGSATTACSQADWQIAVLDTLVKLDAVPRSSESYWVGAVRPAVGFEWVNSDPVIPASWESGSEPVPTSGNDCAVVSGDSQRLANNINCTDTERYICTFPQR